MSIVAELLFFISQSTSPTPAPSPPPSPPVGGKADVDYGPRQDISDEVKRKLDLVESFYQYAIPIYNPLL
ncbi:hypothetical protein EYC84_011749 [Monilinia fructicola]|uniref:Uncharacterized protein n=1 Tax=Monilinia fructicola TaxID=38448 RepID=A0A5M9J5S7_MONFR|nr:hypothetical protein EYC84_011749 [Monilinia fructicola]